MSRLTINYTIKIWVKGNDELIDKLVDSLTTSELPIGSSYDVYNVNSELMYKEVKYTDVKLIKGYGWEEGDFAPGCMYTSNGDGYPDSFEPEDGNFVEYYFDEFIADFKKKYPELNIINVEICE